MTAPNNDRFVLAIAVGEYTGKDNNHWDPGEVGWGRFCGKPIKATRNKHEVLSYVLGTLKPVANPKTHRDGTVCASELPHRNTSNVVSRSGISLDGDFLARDGDPDGERLRKHVADLGYEALVYETFSSKPGDLRYRLVFPLAASVPSSEYGRIARVLMTWLGWDGTVTVDTDDEGKEVHRYGPFDRCSERYTHFMYEQGRVTGEGYRERFRGRLLDPGDFDLEDDPKPRRELSALRKSYDGTLATEAHREAAEGILRAAVRAVARAGEGNRNNTLFSKAVWMLSYAAAGALDKDEVITAMTEAALESGLEEDEIVGTLESAWDTAEDDPDLPTVTTAAEVFADLAASDDEPERPDWAADLDEYKDNNGEPAAWYRRINRDHHVVIGGALTPVTVTKVPGGGGLFFEHNGHWVELWSERCRYVAEDGAWCSKGQATHNGDTISNYCKEHGKEVAETALADDIAARLVAGGSFLLDIPEHTPAVWGSGDKVLWAEGESLMLVGPPGVGKTTVAAQVVEGRLFGGALFGLPVTKTASRVLYLAMDRPQQIGRALRRTLGEHSRETLDEGLVFWKGPPPEDVMQDPKVFLNLARAADADTVVVDSIKDAAIGLSEDKVGAAFNKARQECLANGVEMLELHHMVKRGSGESSEPTALSDVYGSAWLTAGAGSVLLLWGAAGDESVRVVHLKQPSEVFGPHQVIHDHARGRSWIDADETVDLLGLLRKAGGDGLTLAVAAGLYLGKEKVNKGEKAKVRRMLDALVRKRLATRDGENDVIGYTWFSADAVADAFADLKIEGEEPSI